MFITCNTPKQARNFLKRREQQGLMLAEEYAGGDYPIYNLFLNERNEFVESMGVLCGCGCGRYSISYTIIGKLKKSRS